MCGRSKDELIRKLQCHPLPFHQRIEEGYPTMMHDIRAMQQEGCLFVMGEPPTLLLHYLNPALGLRVDEDVRRLWHAHGNSDVVSGRKRARQDSGSTRPETWPRSR